MARLRMYPRFFSKIAVLLLAFFIIFFIAITISFLSLEFDHANNSHHCVGLADLRKQISEQGDDFEKNIKELRSRLDQMKKEGEESNLFSFTTLSNDRQGQNMISTKSYRKTTWAKSDEELANILKEIVLRNKESSSLTTKLNNTANELTPVRRTIPDTRYKECVGQTYPDVSTMPTVSVVIIFCDEPLQFILRNIYSILDKSPSNLIQEIILVDDKSTLPYLKSDLDLYVSYLPNVRVIHNKKREGLVKSRMIGARSASADVLVFFDAHMEVNVQWLEPLLAILMREPSAILQPRVDIISDNDIKYYTLESEVPFTGGFGWDLRFAWFKLPSQYWPKNKTEHFWTPVLVGNAIVVRKDHFFRIGGFDEELKIWGGEHFDLSFRNWLCAGHVYTVPCSRVGHLFKKASEYSYEGDREAIIVKNLMRVAEIWLEEYKNIFYRVTKVAASKMPRFTKEDLKSIRKRIQLKRTLKCKPFKWYLDNILPDQILPRQDALLFGEITHVKSQKCLAVHDDFVGFTSECFLYRILPYNTFTFTKTNKFLFEDKCVYIDVTSQNLRINTCSNTTSVLKGTWKFLSQGKDGRIQFVTKTGEYLCVNTPVSETNDRPLAKHCSASGSDDDIWSFMYRLAEI